MCYIGGPQQVAYLNLELEFAVVLVEKLGVQADKIVQEGFLAHALRLVKLELGVDQLHDLITILVVIAAS